MNKIRKLMEMTDICVLSTASKDGQSHSAVVGFSSNDKYEILIGTSAESRKFKTIKENPKVSLVIGWDDNLTIQYEGVASQLIGEQLIERQTAHLKNYLNRKNSKTNRTKYISRSAQNGSDIQIALYTHGRLKN